MAITKIIKVKVNEKASIRYISDDLKTRNGELVSCFGCEKEDAAFIFKASLLANDRSTGRTPVRAYHIIQSFAPDDDISPEDAHALGLEMMKRLFQSKYAFVCATHTDTAHLHNHFVVCAAERSMSGRKINDNLKLLYNIRDVSNELCREYGLSVITKKKGRGKKYYEWSLEKSGGKVSKKQQLRDLMDSCIRTAADFDDFLKKMEEAGAKYETKISTKKGQVTKYKLPGATEKDYWNRGYRLGEAYSDGTIKRRIENRIKWEQSREAKRKEREEARKAAKDSMTAGEKAIDRTRLKIKSMVDTGELSSSERNLTIWRNRQNAMLAEKIKSDLKTRYNIDYTGIKGKINELAAENTRKSSVIDRNMEDIENLREAVKYLSVYADTYQINERFKKSKDQERYFQDHEDELSAFDVADRYLSLKQTDKTLLQKKGSAEDYIKIFREKLESLENINRTLKEEIAENEKAIAELKEMQKNLNKYHNRTNDEI